MKHAWSTRTLNVPRLVAPSVTVATLVAGVIVHPAVGKVADQVVGPPLAVTASEFAEPLVMVTTGLMQFPAVVNVKVVDDVATLLALRMTVVGAADPAT